MNDDTEQGTGETVRYVVTHLEMDARPTWPVPPAPIGPRLALIGCTAPPVEWFLHLYTQVGAAHAWTDWLDCPEDETAAFSGADTMHMTVLMVDGWPGGFFMLDHSAGSVCDLAYFGLIPRAIGRGLGRWLLGTAVHAGWDLPGVTGMTVHTNTLDHPRALGLYQRVGFSPVRRETHERVLRGPAP